MRYRKKRRVSTSGNIHLRYGKIVPKSLAKIVGRCAQCYGPLKYHNTTLACEAFGPTHQGFMHQDDAAPLLAEQTQHLEQMEITFIIKDDQLVPLTDPLERIETDGN